MEQHTRVGVKGRLRDLRERFGAQRFYTLLSDHLRADADGARLIEAFERDPEGGGDALARYLSEHLAGDDVLARKIAAALGPDKGNQFATVVTGGRVDQIVNIARLGLLNLTVRRYLYVFKDLRQLALTLAVVCLVLAGSAGTAWAIRQPSTENHGFNIAVAEFTETPSTSRPEAAQLASEMLFNALNDEYQRDRFGDVGVYHTRMPVIRDDADAEQLALKVHAHMVIYGSVTRIEDEVRIFPRIWVASELDKDVGAISGQHELGVPSEFRMQQLHSPNAVDASGVRQRMVVLVEFTKALSYLNSDQTKLARDAIAQALKSANEYGEFAGQEVLYLFASTIASRVPDLDEAERFADEALRINENYGRAYIAKGNVYYIGGDDKMAAHYYELALHAPDEPYGANVAEKAHVSLGNIAAYRFQQDPNDIAAATEALAHYEAVLESFAGYRGAQSKSLRNLAARAYYGSGIVYQREGNWADSRHAFEETLRLTDVPDMRDRATRRLDEVKVAGG